MSSVATAPPSLVSSLVADRHRRPTCLTSIRTRRGTRRGPVHAEVRGWALLTFERAPPRWALSVAAVAPKRRYSSAHLCFRAALRRQAEGLVDFPRHPQPVQQHGQPARDRRTVPWDGKT